MRFTKWGGPFRVPYTTIQLDITHMHFVSFHYGKATACYKTDLFQLGHHHSDEYSKMDFPPT